MVRCLFLISLITFTTIGCKGQYDFRYNLGNPDIQHGLPAVLNEISGLTDYDSTHVACVQDELGIVFIYNFKKGEIVAQHHFDSVGDFEGLTYTRDALYILRSDGRLTEWNNFPANKKSIRHYQLPVSTSNNEGLCYDQKYNRLLIAAKSKPIDHDSRSERFIYEFRLKNKKLSNEPLYSLNIDNIREKAVKFDFQLTDTNAKGNIKPFNFRPSSLAVHPVTDDIYIISAVEKMLMIMNRKGEIKLIKQLNPDLYLKAEGITFLNDGTMIITNEAAGKIPVLYVFKYNR